MAKIKRPTLTVKCSQFAFDELFEKFNKAVKSKQYKKFDYDAWCKIRKTIKEHCSRTDKTIIPTNVHFDIDTNEVLVAIGKEGVGFQSDDKSFGQFLANEWTPRFITDVLMSGIEVREVSDYVISTKPTPTEQTWKETMCANDSYCYKIYVKQREEINNYYNDVNQHYEKIYTDADKYKPSYATAQPSNLSWRGITGGPIVDNTATKATTNTEKPDGFTIDWNVPTSTTKPITNAVKPDSLTLDWFATTSSTPISADDLGSVVKLNTKADVIKFEPCADQVNICCDDLCKNCKNYEKKDNEEKENKMKGFNFDFGKITNDSIRMSMYGMAVKNASGVWTAYDKGTGDLMDVDVFNFDGSNFLFKMPVAIKDIAVGDVVIHARKPMFVVSKTEAGDLVAIDPVAGEKKTIMPTRSPFGFNFCTKIISLFDNLMGQTPTSENPFGNLWMLMLMDGKSDMKDMLIPMMLMSQANGSTNAFNPMMLMLMNDGDMKDIALPLMLMNQVK
jgi:hypothetical protein